MQRTVLHSWQLHEVCWQSWRTEIIIMSMANLMISAFGDRVTRRPAVR